MKKVLVIVFALTCLLGLVGCDPGEYKFDEDEILCNTTKIELVYYENTNPEIISSSRKNAPIFDFSKVTPIATLDDSLFEDFVKDLTEYGLLVFGSNLNEPIGKTIILYQSDGNMIVFYACDYKTESGFTRYYGNCNIYDENGTFVEYLGDIDSSFIDRLESKYFECNT